MSDDKAPSFVHLVIDNAEEVPAPASSPSDDAPPPKDPTRLAGAPPDLPASLGVTPLGMRDGLAFYLDANGALRGLRANEHSRLGIQMLVNRNIAELERHFPRYGARRKSDGAAPVLGVDYDDVSTAFIAACGRRGPFDPSSQLRGRGAWLGDDGELVLHCGDAVMSDGIEREPGPIGRFIYPTQRAIARPWPKPVAGGEHGPGAEAIELLATWNFGRPMIDPRLQLGWIGSAFIGGALDFRPHVWLRGSFGVGKSTLLAGVIGGLVDGLIVSSDASAAGIWQKLGPASLPVAVDEMEAEQDNRRQNAVAKLARQASSGGLVLRGGADHSEAEFIARSCFLFSSVLMPSLPPQDISRLCIIELGAPKGSMPPAIEPRRMRELGRQLFRRMVDGWPRLRDTLGVYRQALMAAGHSPRRADVLGSLLACADLLLHDGEPHGDFVAELVEQIELDALAGADDAGNDEEACLRHLLSLAIPIENSASKKSVGLWIAAAKRYVEDTGLKPHTDPEGAAGVLGRYGLKLEREGDGWYLAVASAHAELAKLFAGTHWAGRAGALGVWTQTLRRLPLARPSRRNLWFSGASAKATLIPLDLLPVDPDEAETAPRQRGMQL